MTRGLIQKEDDTMSGTQDGRLEIDKKTQFLLHSLRFGTVGDWQGKVWKADDCQSAGMPSPHFSIDEPSWWKVEDAEVIFVLPVDVASLQASKVQTTICRTPFSWSSDIVAKCYVVQYNGSMGQSSCFIRFGQDS